MKSLSVLRNNSVWIYSILTIFIALVIGWEVLNPIWSYYAVPSILTLDPLPPITAPVDGVFYLRNADHGYAWRTRDPLSLWFHPLLSCIVSLLPKWLPSNFWFWVTSLIFAGGCLLLIYRVTQLVTPEIEIPVWFLPLCLIAPGGLGMATGNAEIPTLFFALLLLLSVLHWQYWWLTVLAAAAVILTKPNGLYMIPVLIVYFVAGLLEANKMLWKQAFIGMISLLSTWLLWIWIVDWQTGYSGAYWQARDSFKLFIGTGGVRGFFEQLSTSFLYTHNLRDQIRYSTALVIPFANLLIIGLVPFSQIRHRYAFAAGNLAMLGVTLYLGNPNKTLVYTTTLPSHFVVHLLLIQVLLTKPSFINPVPHFLLIIGYLIYCLMMLVIYILGTPLQWYY